MVDRFGGYLGNYRLLKLLGKGGFAEVYLGEHIHLGTFGAIKILTSKLSSEEQDHFREEARTIARLRHPNIVRVLEFGVQQDGLPYLVMDYAPNGTLRHFFRKGDKFEPLAILPYVQQVAEALQFAHDRKLIHRDVKPENMLVGENKEVLLSDFGIAVVAQSSRHQDVHEIVGTLAYMAPEQIQAHPRQASDQYSLGIVIYEWLTGVRPFSGSMSEILAKQISAPPPPIRDRIPNVSSELEQVVLTALAKDPKNRFASIRAFMTAFAQAAQAQGSTTAPSPEIPSPGAPGIEQANTVISSPSTPVSSSPSSNWPAFVNPSGPASTPSAPPLAADSGPHQDVYSAPTALPSGPSGASAGVIFSPGQAPDPSGPYRPVPSSPANREANFLEAPTVLGTFLSPTEAPQIPQPVIPAPPGWQSSQPVPSAPPGWQFSQPGPSAPPGWQPSQPAFPSGPAQMDAPTLTSGPVGPIAPLASPPQPGPTTPPTKRGVSRRRVLVAGAAGVAGLAVVGGGVTWFILANKQGSPITQSQTTANPTVPTIRPVYIFHGHAGAVYNAAWSIDGSRIASAGNDHTVQIWDALTGTNAVVYREHTGPVRAISFSPDKQFLASASDDKTVHISKLASNTSSFLYKVHTNAVLTVAWAPSGLNVASGSLDQTARIWNSSTGALSFKVLLEGQANHPTSVAWSPNGKQLAIASSDGVVRIWDIAANQRLATAGEPATTANTVAWSPDGKFLVSGWGDGTARFWNATTGKAVAEKHTHTGSVNAVAWSPDGKYIATASADTTVVIYNAASHQNLRAYHGHNVPILSIAWSPDSQYMVSAGQDGAVHVWKPLEGLSS